jgi:hypothetical protein
VSDNRRSSTRFDVSLPAQLTINGEVKTVELVNLSLGGALIAGIPRIAMGLRAQISFSVPMLENAIDIGATVRWSDDKATGLQFDGLRARDVWGLNKFFEQLSSSS